MMLLRVARNRMAFRVAGSVLALLLSASLEARAVGEADAAAVETARAAVSGAMAEVLSALSNENLSDAARLEAIKGVAYSNFDFATMSKLVLARSWRSLDADQQREFVKEFRDMLARSYGKRLKRYSDEGVRVVGARAEPRGDVSVETRIVGGNFDGAVVRYRMRLRLGAWKAIDAVVEGISLVSSYRSQFREVLSSNSIAELLERMRKKNALASAESTKSGTGFLFFFFTFSSRRWCQAPIGLPQRKKEKKENPSPISFPIPA